MFDTLTKLFNDSVEVDSPITHNQKVVKALHKPFEKAIKQTSSIWSHSGSATLKIGLAGLTGAQLFSIAISPVKY